MEKKQTIEKSFCDGIEYSLHESAKVLDNFVGTSYKYNFYNDKCLSLREYIENGYIRLYLELILEMQKGESPLDVTLILPEYFRIIEPDYAHYADLSRFKFHRKVPLYKKKALKTKPKYYFNLSAVGILRDILEKIYEMLPDDFDMLLPSNFSPEGDWRQTFYNIKTGESFFCSCFRTAIEIERSSFHLKIHHPHIKYAMANNSYKDDICHLCTKVPPPRSRFNSTFSGIYGQYIYKVAIENGYLTAVTPEECKKTMKNAENIIRKLVGFPLIGEGWVSETDLYKRIKSEFPNLEVIHHGRPSFLLNQEYDIWIPKFKIAIEYQGIQHFTTIDHWGGEEGLTKRQELDKKKYKISSQNGVTLFYAKEGYNFPELLQKIKATIEKS
jgi:hypothetical protein